MKKKVITKKLLMRIIVIGVIVIMGIFGLKRLKPSFEINDERFFSAEGISELQINMTKEQIHFLQSKTNEMRLHYHGASKQELKLNVENKNGKMIINSTRKTNLMYENLYLDIYIPENYKKQISVNTTSGKVIIEQITVEKISVISTSGNINLKDCVGNIDLEASSGNIMAEQIVAEKNSVVTTSGSINLKDCTGNFNLKASSGNILLFYKIFDEQNINIFTTSGYIELNLPDTAEFSLEMKTSTGKMLSDFEINTVERKKMVGQIGTKHNKIILESTTGGISVLKNN